MTKNIDDKALQFDLKLEAIFQVSALALASTVSVTAFAPVLPHEVKENINHAVGTDLDVAHENLKTNMLLAVEKIDMAITHISNGGERQAVRSRKSAKNKGECPTIEIGQWVFTIPTPNCI